MLPILLGLALTAPGDAPASRLILASDLPRLARSGVRVPISGDYTIQVWGPGDPSWGVSDSENALEFFGKETPGSADARPSWRVVGRVPLSADRPVTVRVRGATFDPPTISGNYQSGKQKVTGGASSPVPAMIFLSTATDADPSAAMAIARGRLDSTLPTDDLRRTSVRTNHEGAQFRPPETAEAWRDRSRDLREQLLVTLGLWPMPPKTPLHPRVYGKVARDGYTIEKVVLESLPGFVIAGNLYRPAGPTTKRPGILSPHGHYEEGRVHPDVQARCIGLARLGAVVFDYEMVGYNDTKPFGHAFLNDRLDLWGLSLPTLQTWNSLRALDWLASLPDVDAARLGCTGESGGSTQTFLLTAIDSRIAVSAPVVMVSERFQGGCVCENASGLRLGTDNVEIAALTAPRPMILVGATGDWTSNNLTKVFPAIRGVYEKVGRASDLEAFLFDFPHNYNQTSRNAVYPFFGRRLLGIDDAEATKEGPQTLEKPVEMLAFDAAHPAPSDLRTPKELEAELIGQVGAEIEAMAPANDPALWAAFRDRLKTATRVRVGLEDRLPTTIRETEVRRESSEGLQIVHFRVGRVGQPGEIPVVLVSKGAPTVRVAVIAEDRGKAALVGPDGRPTPVVRALLDRGIAVIGFDPFLVGESFDPLHPADRRPNTVHNATYNRVLAAERMRDLAAVIGWAGPEQTSGRSTWSPGVRVGRSPCWPGRCWTEWRGPTSTWTASPTATARNPFPKGCGCREFCNSEVRRRRRPWSRRPRCGSPGRPPASPPPGP